MHHSTLYKLATAAALLGSGQVFVAPATTETIGDSRGFNFKESDSSLELWEKDRPVLAYNFGKQNLPGKPEAGTRACYFHPIYGLEGEVLTDDFPDDHFHHHGLFWGWPHVRIGDQEYDLWKMRGIDIQFQRWLRKEADSKGATVAFENAWIAGNEKVLREQVTARVSPAMDDYRCVDLEFTWTPLERPITLGGAEGKSYGGISLRFAPRNDTVITVPEGRAKEDLLVTRLPWADLAGTFKKGSQASGAALFVDPRNPDSPPQWMTRDYGLLAIGWPGVKAQLLPAGEPLTCRYRLWIHRGTPDAAAIQSAYEEYTNISKGNAGKKKD